jgi:hypothetical protein
MDPFLEKSLIFHDLHTQILTLAQGLLQPQLRPKYVARLERHLSEGSVWGMEEGLVASETEDSGITIVANLLPQTAPGSTAVLATATASTTEELDTDELELRKQRRIVIYVRGRPRLPVTSIELLSPSNKAAGSVG